MAMLLTAMGSASDLGAQSGHRNDPWALFQSATEDRALIAPALAQVRGMRQAGVQHAAGEAAALLDAYEGALLAMTATTTDWPPSKLSRARGGLALLDRAVGAGPGQPEVRYLRMVICHHLPSFFRRRETARSDADVLATLILRSSTGPPTARERQMAAFLLETGYLDDSVEAAIDRRFVSYPQ